jgi:hypothetical protein
LHERVIDRAGGHAVKRAGEFGKQDVVNFGDADLNLIGSFASVVAVHFVYP